MHEERQAETQHITVSNSLTMGDLGRALKAGWQDYRAKPAFGLFFASLFAIGGLMLTYLLGSRGETAWLIPAAAGFPLLAPFTAVGLYEVSRRRELGLPLTWSKVLTAVKGRGDDQILSMGVIIFVAFGFWMIVAHGVYAIFLGESGLGSDPTEIVNSMAGLTMLAVGSVTGGLMALAFYSITVFSLPMLVDRDVDFLTAIITSLQAMRDNKYVLLVWAFLVAAILFVAMIPLFLGLLVALPVLGHATWHLYRTAIRPQN
ncbi:DUF2189 domain-containing protein [Aurantiacibacter sp. D1-12]|uniref:DUF2189 domain-containing protein n=1 Tax=Aurantiacibacter sp. D1-12 TaxID=2993658 RepID=UPI00237C92DB|nr:DUF2189 domain-containing protein [Aurantiacibacter sp. D1-12]MDE1467746.1 DUF2189 domain-containing protein [Aurantiacibacter sp. D1-12]